MKIEKLTDNKIRITLNIEDLTEKNIDFQSFMSNSIESQDIFFDMLDKAEKEVGFNTDDCRIMIEALALKDGHFVLTITKFEHNSEKMLPNKKHLHIKRKSPSINFEKTIYSFESFNTFCDFCTFLSNILEEDQISDFAESSDLYEYNSNYYLILTNINTDSLNLTYICSSITEFAHFVNSSELFERKIKEYGKVIIKNSAILTCMEHFV
ncbi:MAG: adaptor protein MecA [Clostridia bacterium]|nr:adaptor protein MecA [Clostridia bacterium]